VPPPAIGFSRQEKRAGHPQVIKEIRTRDSRLGLERYSLFGSLAFKSENDEFANAGS